MKTIEVSDKDYDTLMELSKELQVQPNHSQAFPYFWEPASYEEELDANNEGSIVYLYDYDNVERYTPDEYAKSFPDVYKAFLAYSDVDFDVGFDEEEAENLESEWIDYVVGECSVDKYSANLVQKQKHNPSLFLEDVKMYIENNNAYLGKDPCTYANTFQRMPKMDHLIRALCRLNPQPQEVVNEELWIYVFGNKSDA